LFQWPSCSPFVPRVCSGERYECNQEASAAARFGNKGYRRYLKLEGSGHFVIDEKQVKAEQRYDGVWVLRTNTDYNAETVAHVYKALWTVADIFRTTKSILKTRPIYHKRDETIRGHVFCSFLALLLKRELESRIQLADLQWEWKEVIRGLGCFAAGRS
jgi:transposase